MMIVGMFGRLGFFFLNVDNGFELQYIHTLSFPLSFTTNTCNLCRNILLENQQLFWLRMLLMLCMVNNTYWQIMPTSLQLQSWKIEHEKTKGHKARIEGYTFEIKL